MKGYSDALQSMQCAGHILKIDGSDIAWSGQVQMHSLPDDILVIDWSFQEYMANLKKVITQLKATGLSFESKKCQLVKQKVSICYI